MLVEGKVNHNKEPFSKDHFIKYFSLPELKLVAKVTGFEFLFAEEWLAKQALSENTWGITCVLIKNIEL